MANKKDLPTNKKNDSVEPIKNPINPEVMKSVWGIILIGLSVVLILASIAQAGPAGQYIFSGLSGLLGLGYYLLPISALVIGVSFLLAEHKAVMKNSLIGGTVFFLSCLSIMDVIYPNKAGFLGVVLGTIEIPFGYVASIAINIVLIIVGIVIVFHKPIKLKHPEFNRNKNIGNKSSVGEPSITMNGEAVKDVSETADQKNKLVQEDSKKIDPHIEIKEASQEASAPKKEIKKVSFKNYVPPPISLLKSTIEKPTVGDLRANANIIQRALESFGIPVEMGEITIGPKVTRYTLKPAEGVKLSRITALNQDLSLSLAAHPLRIEAPIPGKSLVGIEVPNKIPAVVRLGSILNDPEFNTGGILSFGLGRGIAGDPVFPNIAKMPHMLVAGATGSGKSVTIHSIIISLLYKNSPETLKFIFVDPKRVELSVYQGIPHLIAPVITEGKKAVSALRWAIAEMDRRYETLMKEGFREIKTYNEKHKDDPLPYIVIIIDELADLMVTYGREVESSIVRLAQMARATGIHLIVSTQRPSVEVITGLIKANITSRIALQVASQIDSRTILDMSGAEKLLGGGDMLLVSSDLSKPKRIQGSYVTDEEIKSVVDFIIKNNEGDINDLSVTEPNELEGILSSPTGEDGDDDELFPEAMQVVIEAQKASASLLQRRLKVGYARAARLLDIMESKGIIGPGDGAKPRDVYLNHDNQQTNGEL